MNSERAEQQIWELTERAIAVVDLAESEGRRRMSADEHGLVCDLYAEAAELRTSLDRLSRRQRVRRTLSIHGAGHLAYAILRDLDL